MLFLYISLLVYSFYRGLRGNIRIVKSYRYLNSKNGQAPLKNTQPLVKFFILIPVLREQEIVEETVHHFAGLKGDYEVCLITTEKEVWQKRNSLNIPEKYKSLPTTREVALKYLSSHPELAKRVKIIHYPETHGVMAHQVNYALSQLKKKAKPNDYVVVYNADSRVRKDILNKYTELIQSKKDCRVIQQSAVFLANYNKLSPLLRSIALLQTRWTMAHEIPRILNASSKWNISEGAHVVGHGLCLQYKFIVDIGGFPQDLLNEDLPLGYFIRLYGAKIYLLKELENADTPKSIKSMFNQYRTWFYGLLYYPKYIIMALNNPIFKKHEAIVWGVKYCIRGILWLGLSANWILLFILPLWLKKPEMLFLSVLSFIIYAPISYLLVCLTVGKDFGIRLELIPILLSPIVFLTHSFGPSAAVYDVLYSKIHKMSIYKNKTER